LKGVFWAVGPPCGYRLADAGPHCNPAMAALGARHRLEFDSQTAPVVEQIFAMRPAGYSVRRIAKLLNADCVPCPSAHDPVRNRHRLAAGWTAGTVLAALSNPRYTGYEVWNKQSKVEMLVDARNVGLGTRTVMRWNPREEWVYSRRQVHPAIVSVDDFERARSTRALRQARRTYLLRGLLRCELCKIAPTRPGRAHEGSPVVSGCQGK
jgi:hypothetical protein